jgi:hypothetical protein
LVVAAVLLVVFLRSLPGICAPFARPQIPTEVPVPDNLGA